MNRSYIIIMLIIIAVVGWYLFRPERLFIDSKINEGLPPASPGKKHEVLFRGSFHEVAHPAKGTATIYKLTDRKRILRLTEFEVSNGPDVVIYLVAVDDAHDDDSVKNSNIYLWVQ